MNTGQIANLIVKKRQNHIEILEMDELYIFIKKPRRNAKTWEFSNPYTRIWTAVDRNRFKNITLKIGNRSKS